MTEKNGTLNTENVTPAKLTMVVPVWNQLDFTVRMVESMRRWVQIPYRLVIIDNGSTDGTTEYVKSLVRANPDRVKAIFNHSNRGFSKAMNQGMEHVVGHMLWLNNDVEFVRPGMIESLVHKIESDEKIGAIGPVTDMCLGPQMVTDARKYPALHPARFLIGFCMLVREEVWKKVGRLDEHFGDAGEDDLDYSIRIRKLGYKLVVDRTSFVHHYGGATMQIHFNGRDQYRDDLRKGRQILIAKWGKDVVEEMFLPPDFTGVRVMVSIPTWGDVYPEAYANHLGELMHEVKNSHETGIDFVFAPMVRSSICSARNELVRAALKLECTHLFFLDDDMIVPKSAIHRLVRLDLDIVSGLCHLRTPPHYPSMFMDPQDGTGRIFYIKRWPEGKIIQVDAVGSACVLIKTHVFEKIKDMAFPGDLTTCPECSHNFIPFSAKKAGEGLWYLYGKARPGEHTVGEDVFFCRLAGEAGFKIYVDTSLEFGHVGPPLVYDTDYYKRVTDKMQNEMRGIPYEHYEQAREYSISVGSIDTPEQVADRLGGGGERGEFFRRLYAGRVGDGRYPGPVSAANKCGSDAPDGPVVPV